MDLSLKDKVAIVTGASTGIGKAIAFGMAEEGAKVSICARRKELLEEVAKEIRSATGSEILPIKADVTKSNEIENLVNKTIEIFGRIDILVNNAGAESAIDRTKDKLSQFLALSDKNWQESIDVNLFGVIRCSRAVLPYMKKQGGGKIINISSIYGKQPGPGIIDYNVTKAGVISFTKTLADSLAKDNILVNAVCPGLTKTPLWDRVVKELSVLMKMSPEEVTKTFSTQFVPLGRFAEPREIANMIVFLASEKASYITGQSISVDGGMSKFMM